MKNYLCVMAYDGSCFHGFQSQPDGITVQDTVERALNSLTGESIKITGCGRTDAGVHALNYCFNFKSSTTIPTEALPLALNSRLPDSISVKSAREAAEDFHSGFSAIKKTYIYKIRNSRIRDPFMTGYSWFFPAPLDIAKMKEAAEQIEGEHDFSAFMAQGGSVKTTVRTVYSIDISKSGELISIAVTGNGFLYNMVRIIAGTLVSAGTGKLSPSEIPGIISSKRRENAGPTAPACGLYLSEVFYPCGMNAKEKENNG